MKPIDPYTPGEEAYYECVRCDHREMTMSYRATCPECGSEVRNIGVPRE